MRNNNLGTKFLITLLLLGFLISGAYSQDKHQPLKKSLSRPQKIEIPKKISTLLRVKAKSIIPAVKKIHKRIYIHLKACKFDPLIHEVLIPEKLKIRKYSPQGTGYYILQFDQKIRKEWRDVLRNKGVRIFWYIPDFALLVKMSGKTKNLIEGMEHVRWVGIYQPAFRIDPELFKKYIQQAETEESVELIVVLFEGEDIQRICEKLEALGGTILETFDGKWEEKIKVRINSSKISEIAKIPGVKWIERAPVWKLFNNVATHSIMNVANVRDNHGLYGAGQIIGICDTGLDKGSTDPAELHDDFEDGNGNSRILQIFDLVGDGASDVNSGHGTHVAGSVLGNGIMSGSNPLSHYYPDTSFAGVAPEASLIFQAAEGNSTGKLTGIPANLNSLFQQAQNAGATIHTNSWGSSAQGVYDSMAQDVDEYMWDHKNFLILFAAGNEGKDENKDGVIDPQSITSPGRAKNCITVGASESDRPEKSFTWDEGFNDYEHNKIPFPAEPIKSDGVSDNPSGMAAFSGRGPCEDGRYKPDVVAPGTNILSVRSSVATQGLWGHYNEYYEWSGGTSMSTPLVAGTAALVRQFYTDIEGITPSAALIKATLINGAVDISPGQYGTGSTQEIPNLPLPNNVEGWGRVNLGNSIFPDPPRVMKYWDISPGLNTDETHTYNIVVTDSSEPLRVTLVWTDYPSDVAASKNLVNDLDLTVTDPNSTIHYPKPYEYIGYSTDGTIENYYSAYQGWEFAVKFTPSYYPVVLYGASFYISSPAEFTLNVWDDDGPDGKPGTNLFTQDVTPTQEGWFTVDIPDIVINEGSFYIGMHFKNDTAPSIAVDTSSPQGDSWFYDGNSWRRDWENVGLMDNNLFIWSRIRSLNDRINNVVRIDINNPPPGEYTVTVKGYNVPYGPQPYALVISGAISEELVISGMVTTSTGTSIPDVSMTFSGLGTTQTNDGGFYSFIVPYGWSGTITASKSGWTFNDNPRSVGPIYDHTRIDFVGTPTDEWRWEITGKVTDSHDDFPIQGVKITASGNGYTDIDYTNFNGEYTVRIPDGWSGNVTAELDNYSFRPGAWFVSNVHQGITDLDFEGTNLSTLPDYIYAGDKYSDFSPQQVNGGEQWSVHGEILNQGETAGEHGSYVNIYVTLEPCNSVTELQQALGAGTAYYIGSDNIYVVHPGDTEEFRLDWEPFPNTIPNGIYYVTFYVDPSGGIDETNDENNVSSKMDKQLIVGNILPDKAANPNPPDGATGVTTAQGLSWEPGANAESYDIYFGLASEGLVFRGNQSASDRTWDFPEPLLSEREYIWRIDTLNQYGKQEGDVWHFTSAVIENPPPSPSNFSHFAKTQTSITWTWQDNSDNKDGFKIQDENDNTVGTVGANTTQFTETGLSPNTQYTRHVRAYNQYGDSGPSNSHSTYTLPKSPDVSCDKQTNTSYDPGITFTFTNNARWGEGNLDHYHYVWNTSSTYTTWIGNESVWSSGDLSITENTPGSYYLYVISHNPEHESGGSADYGPYVIQSQEDTDHDGLPDSWELQYFGTLDYGPNDDPDNDGLTNLEEYNLSTNPANQDTDGDGLPDGWEHQYGLDPNDATGNNGANGDPDNDGYTNLQEYQGGSDPTDENSTPATGWYVPLNIELNGSSYSTLVFGMQEGATDNFDTGIDQIAPPASPDGDDAYFSSITGEASPYNRLLIDKRGITDNLTIWRLEVKVANGKSMRISWDSQGLPEDVNSLTWQEADENWDGMGDRNNLSDTGEIDITNDTGNLLTKRYLIRASSTTLFNLHLEAGGWNLISLPINPINPDPEEVFGDKLIAIFRWDAETQKYVIPEEIKAKEGYWVAVSENVDLEIEGTSPESTSVHLLPGWNLVGPVGNQDNPLGTYSFVIAVWGWSWPPDYRYIMPESCEEGKGYWVAATQEGEIW